MKEMTTAVSDVAKQIKAQAQHTADNQKLLERMVVMQQEL